MNCYKVCEGCKHKIITVNKNNIKEKCKFDKNYYQYKNAIPYKCIKYELKNNNNNKNNLTKRG